MEITCVDKSITGVKSKKKTWTHSENTSSLQVDCSVFYNRMTKMMDHKAVAEHAATHDCWLILDGCVYDVSAYVKQHSGGRRIAVLAGEDATAMVLGSHGEHLKRMMAGMKVGEITSAMRAPFSTEFMADLQCRVRQELKGCNESSLDIWLLVTTCMWLSSYVGSHVFGLWPLAILLGLCSCALVGMFAHEHAHGCLTPDPERTKLGRRLSGAAWALFFPTMSQPHFIHEHFRHHEAPMDSKKDYEVAALAPFIRLSGDVEWKPRHQWMYLLAPAFYSFYISVQFVSGFFNTYFASRSFSKDKAWHYEIWVCPLISILFHVAIPLLLLGFWKWALVFLVFNITWQLTTYVMAAAPHLTEHKLPSDSKSWAEWVCKTTVNLNSGFFTKWLAGGFDYQIEHHLLPWVPRRSLAKVSAIVKECCDKAGFPYRTYTSFWTYISDHRHAVHEWSKPPII